MLRPTESKVLFLQQLGRGLRCHPGKKRLVVLDFIGNHTGFLNKPQALFGVGSSYRELADFARRVRDQRLDLPPGCYANYDLAVIDFLAHLQGKGPEADYDALKESLGRRPTLSEFFRSGTRVAALRSRHGQWWGLVHDQGDLSTAEAVCLERHGDMVIERQDATGDNQYLLRVVTKTPEGRYFLKATNPEYPDYEATDNMRTLARLQAVLSSEDVIRANEITIER